MASLGSLAKRALPTVAASDNQFKLLDAGGTQLNVWFAGAFLKLAHASPPGIPDANEMSDLVH